MHTYKYDLHVHTSETSPCGTIPAVEVVRHYKTSGYDGIVITDHYYSGYFEQFDTYSWDEKIDQFLYGYKNALKAGSNVGFTVLLGMEIRFDENQNDYLVYGINENFLREYKELYALSLDQFREITKSKNIMIYQAHPFRSGMIPASPKFMDGVEIYNGNPRHQSNNPQAAAYANLHGLKSISGSDFHQISDLARGGIEVPCPIHSEQELILTLRDSTNLRYISKGE